MELTLKTEWEMEALGERVARALQDGGFVALYGDLGAGKTVLCRGAGKALGLDHLSSAAPLPFRRLSAGGRGRAVRHGL